VINIWNLTKEKKERFLTTHLLPIHESDEDWERALISAKEEGEDLISILREELDKAKEGLRPILPSKIVPFLEDGTLNQPTLPKDVREEYIQWLKESEREFGDVLDAAHNQTMMAITHLSSPVQDIFSQSLHDSSIERIERDGDTLHLYINTDGGFSTISYVHFIFQQVTGENTDSPLQFGQYIIYYELQKAKEGFSFRILFESPETEWTISMKNLEATYFFRPKAFTILTDEAKLQDTSLEDYLSRLNLNHRYWFITPDSIGAIEKLSNPIQLENGSAEIKANETIVTIDEKSYSYSYEDYHPIWFIYSDQYEDPYAHLNEPVPKENLLTAALSKQPELQVRAWNTLYTNPKEHADIIHQILEKIEVTEENEMMLYVYVKHFYQEGILSEEIMEKFQGQ
jgi:hypothetical protein